MSHIEKTKFAVIGQPSRLETAAYIRDLADELAKQARKDELNLLAYLLEMARHEAERCEQTESLARQH